VLASGKQCSTSPPYVELCQNSKAVKNPSHSVGLRFFFFCGKHEGWDDRHCHAHTRQVTERKHFQRSGLPLGMSFAQRLVYVDVTLFRQMTIRPCLSPISAAETNLRLERIGDLVSARFVLWQKCQRPNPHPWNRFRNEVESKRNSFFVNEQWPVM
jgi:hypothetical protein